MIYVNKMDIMGADFYNVLNMIHDRLKCNAVPIQLPIGKEDTFRGIIDLVENDADIYYDEMGKDMRVEEIPADMMELAQEYRTKLVDACADLNDEIMELALEEQPIPEDLIRKTIRQATIDNLMVPGGLRYFLPQQGRGEAPGRHRGLYALPGGHPPHQGHQSRYRGGGGASFLRYRAFLCSGLQDRYRSLCRPAVLCARVLRVLNTVPLCSTPPRSSVRIGRILQMHANHREDIECCYSGDIAAVVGLKNSTTGDTLCDEKHPVILESMEFPDPVIRVAIEPKTKAGQEKMGLALVKLAEEDPTFRTWTDEETGQTIIAGMGELHLEIIVDRLLREFKVEANVGAPQVAYKETIKKSVEQDTKYARQSGGKGQYGHVRITVEPNEPGKGYEFLNQDHRRRHPQGVYPCGRRRYSGRHAGGYPGRYPVVDVKVHLTFVYHEVDSSEMAFKIAGSMAFKEACRKADAVLLEPVMKSSLSCPTSIWAMSSATSPAAAA